MNMNFTYLAMLLLFCSCAPKHSAYKVRLNIYTTSIINQEFNFVVKTGESDSTLYGLKGTDEEHDELYTNDRTLSVSITDERFSLSQSLSIDASYEEPTIDVYFTYIDSTLDSPSKQGLSVFHYDKNLLLRE